MMSIGLEAGRRAKIANVKTRFGSPLSLAYWTFLALGPVLFVVSAFFYGWDFRWHPHAGTPFGYCVVAYLPLLPIVFIIGLVKNWRKALLFLGASVLTVGLIIMLPITHFLLAAGFYCAIYPQGTYIRKHCHPASFQQDGHVYAWGACDGTIDSYGQTDINVIYDTSGDTLYDGVHDRKEWVDAVRKFYKDDPNEEFEQIVENVNHIYGPFYFIWFDEDNGDRGGFSDVYGPPPPNVNNRFRPF